MNDKSRKALEFDKVLDQLATHAVSKKSKRLISEIIPLQCRESIEKLLKQVEEADKILYFYSLTPPLSVDDVEFILDKAEVMSILTMGELLKVAKVLRVSKKLQETIMGVDDEEIVLLKDIASKVYTNNKLEVEIEKAIISETEMNDNASNDLRIIRNKIRKIGDAIKAKLYNFTHSPAYAKYLQDGIITVRNDRYVLPVKMEYKNAVPGLIHDQSSSKATIYVEPMVIVELNNQLKSYIIEENEEVERILKDFTFRVSVDTHSLRNSFDKIIELDIIFAKAMYANSQKAIKPIINDNCFIDVENARHPLIEPSKIVANTIKIGQDFKMLFITGPNTGGKTVCLKLAGLVVLMALSGLFVPANNANIGIFKNVFCDIGDEQSIEQNLSTFSSHIYNIKNIIDQLTENTLVLLDELGAGTDPTEGASLALSIARYLNSKGTVAIITTHYNELKEYAMVTEGMKNASMEFDLQTYSPTYRLIIGIPGVSNALLIASKLGLRKDIIEQAKLGVKKQDVEFEKILSQLHAMKKDIDEKSNYIERLKIETVRLKEEALSERERLALQRERINQSVRKETKKLIENSMHEANDIIDTLKTLLDSPSQENIFKAYELRKRLKKFVVNDENEFEVDYQLESGHIKVGDSVLVKPLNAQAKVVAINPIKGEAKVRIGTMTSNANIKNLVKIKGQEKKERVVKNAMPKDLTLSAPLKEINIIGSTTDEVGPILDGFIDQAYMGGIKEVNIIHGIGEGKLRKAVQKYLSSHKFIQTYRDAKYGEGGKGVTVATLK